MIKAFGISEVRPGFSTATLTFALLAMCGIANAQTAPASGSSGSAAATYKQYCVTCHGADGSGTAMGRRFHAPDLRTKEVQDKPTADLAKLISAGKGNMPAFSNRLNSEQIQQLIDYIHQLHTDTAAPK